MVLGFLNQSGKSTYVSEKNHNPYNSFVKRNADIISKRIKDKYIWIPKNLSIFDKNTYIASYIHDIYNSCNYVYTNRWKPNSNWVWVSKGQFFDPVMMCTI